MEDDFEEADDDEERHGTPLTNLLLDNCNSKRVDAWTRRFARACTGEDIPDNTLLEDVRDMLEDALEMSCATNWERENLMVMLTNDGSVPTLEELISKILKRFKEKADAGVGNPKNRSRYGALAVAMSDTGARAHKVECDPDFVFRITSADLESLWSFVDPKPASRRWRPNSWWELRLTTRPWHKDKDERFCFALQRGWLKKSDRDDVECECIRGLYQWGTLMHNGDVYDKYELTLEMASMGNTDRATGETAPLAVVYNRDPKDRTHLNYSRHIWGRVTTSEMSGIDQMFPPRLVQGVVETFTDDDLARIVSESLKRLSKGAQAGTEPHEAFLPKARTVELADQTPKLKRGDID